MKFENWLQNQYPTIPSAAIQAVLKLAEEGSTIPFIARYRKEMTGNQDEVAIQQIIEGKEKWDHIIKRQLFIIEEIKKQEKLTPALQTKIATCFDASLLESIYLPFKQKRKTKAMVAKEAGLEPLANILWEMGQTGKRPGGDYDFNKMVQNSICKEKKFEDAEAVIGGIRDILTERITEVVELRTLTKKALLSKACLQSKKTKTAEPNSKFEMYFDYKEKASSLLKPENSHRYLAIKRGWLAKELSLNFVSETEEDNYEESLLKAFIHTANPSKYQGNEEDVLNFAAKLALKVYVLPSCQKDVLNDLKTLADTAAIQVFSNNVRQLLLSSPFGAKGVMGIDPGIRTGCKIAIVDSLGAYKEDSVIYPGQDSRKDMAGKVILAYCQKYELQAIAIGNGTAGRETEAFVRSVIKEAKLHIPVVLVNESGASIYSASEAAREEFPELDLTVRGAISIARRLQDPLAELVKIDPKSIGVGQYQHDVSPTQLKKSLDLVVESCVNAVGVNLNTASYHLLSHVSGIGPGTAKNIVNYRKKAGLFKSKKELLKVSRFTDKIFEQAAGFLRVPISDNPLDNTGVHPERYDSLKALANNLSKNLSDLVGSGVQLVKQSKELKDELGEFTFNDIIIELEKPGRDSRDEFVVFNFREDINAIDDLKEGMLCPGIVTNVTNFGAFVDIGVHQDGLVHISKLADKFVKDPKDVVSPGDHVKVKVMEINKEKRQIALSMRLGDDNKELRSQPVERSYSAQKKSRPQKSQQKKSFSNNPFAKLGKL
jgi:protein Tex